MHRISLHTDPLILLPFFYVFVRTRRICILMIDSTGVDFNVLNSKFSFDLLPGKRAAKRNNSHPKVCVLFTLQICGSWGSSVSSFMKHFTDPLLLENEKRPKSYKYFYLSVHICLISYTVLFIDAHTWLYLLTHTTVF